MHRILIVDDDTASRLPIARALEKAGHTTVHANDGLVGLDCVGRGQCDVVITDCQMPKMSGLEMTQAIRELPDYALLPIIGMSGEDRKRECLAAGMTTFWLKPISLIELVRNIEKLCPK